MSWLSRIFGNGGTSDSESAASETYKGFTITPAPQKDGGTYRIAATIEKGVNGEEKSHHLIRADTIENYDAACEASVAKAEQMIDQMGERLFG